MATHSEIKDQAIRGRERDIAFLKQQLADALQQLQQQRIAIRADVIEQAKAEARQQAFEDAAEIAESLAKPYKSGGDYERERFLGMIEIAEALRREREISRT